MRPNFLFLLAASNAILKPGGPLKWKKRLVKDVKLLLSLRVMKIVRFTPPLPDVLCLSSPKPRLKHGKRLALLFRPNLTLNLCTLHFVLSLALFPHLPPLLTFPFIPLPGSRLRSSPITWDPTFLYPSQRPCVAELEASFPSSVEPRALKSLTRPFASLDVFAPAEFLAAAINLFLFTANSPDKVAYPMLKHLPRSGMDFLLHIFNLSWTLHSFPSIKRTSSIIPIYKIGKRHDSPSSFWPISLPSCFSKLFEQIILSRLLFFLEYSSILSPRQAGFRPGGSALDQILFLSQFISDEFNNPGRALGRFSLLLISRKLSTLSGIPPFSTNLFRLASLLVLLTGHNLPFLTNALAWFIKITKLASLSLSKCFARIRS